ncbi:unnamed protein product [Pieris macdunnoughi]|uniref:Endonuclease-reverse transcriptase n=1 Tax=Pieris macdunnoughi TaxID=345717 RepID=A0A821SCU9_9NEOP|nr:unnamed protein product [Pieris macdunnoughi]
MLGVRLSDRVKNIEIRKQTNLIDAAEMYCKLKWKWAGHITRVNDGRWSERVLHWYPRDGRRNKGHPVMRWRDEIHDMAGNTWTRDAQNRHRWQNMEEAFTHNRVPN